MPARLALLLLIACSGGSPDDTGTAPTGSPTGTSSGTPTGSTAVAGDPIRCPDDTPEPFLETTTGCLLGRSADGAEGFLGVRYAEAPVGELRWAPPAWKEPVTEPVDATAIGSPCIQTTGTLDTELGPGDGTEDCLFLNVIRPEGTAPGDGLPIVFFVHGGGNIDGHGGGASMIGTSFNRPPDDPPLLAEAPQLVTEQGVIVVTVNYRLGQLGWLAHPGLTEADSTSGNQGLWDVIAALEWVDENAEQLGGSRILVAGESAGAVNACALLASPARDYELIDGLILQSGTCEHIVTALDEAPPFGESAHEQGERLAAALGCDTAPDPVACMRAVPVETVMAAMPGTIGSLDPDAESWGPIVDGVMLDEPPMERLASGAFNHVPVVVGVNADEGTLFTTFAPMPSEQAFDAVLAGVALAYGWDAAGLQALYDPATHYGGDLQAAYAAAWGDLAFVCPARRTADTLAAHTDVRAYWWTHTSPLTAFLGAHHGVEIPYVFGTGLDTGEQGLMNDVATATWASLAADVNQVQGTQVEVPGVGSWPLFGSAADSGGTWLEMSTTPSVLATAPRKTECDWMDTQDSPP